MVEPTPTMKRRLTHEGRITLLAVGAGVPATVVALILLWTGDFSSRTQWTLTIFLGLLWWGLSFAVREWVVSRLRILSNLLAALREGDYSFRARGAGRNDPLGEVMLEVNTLGETLRENRLETLEATTLLHRVMAEIEVAIFAFDDGQRLRLVNRAGERLLAQSSERILGSRAEDLGLADCLRGEPVAILNKTFAGQSGRWGVRRSSFRSQGLPHQLLVLSDLSRTLREEERFAWQRLVRVLGHELNNSLAPIKSITGSLGNLMLRKPRPTDWEEDLHRGLEVIRSRCDSLNRFMQAYSRLARLPRPSVGPVELGGLIHRVIGLETRLPIVLEAGPDFTIQADRDQLEQLLINLVKNAVDAALHTQGAVRMGWIKNRDRLEVWVEDDGPGISDTANLFVPFYTTKPNGLGIGLVLSRQIAEAHGGRLSLENRKAGQGCEARLHLPLEHPDHAQEPSLFESVGR